MAHSKKARARVQKGGVAMRTVWVAVAALRVESAVDTVLVAMPTDHVIQDQRAFIAAIDLASEIAPEGHLVLLGIPPTHPSTESGYVRRSSYPTTHPVPSPLGEFLEKPETERSLPYSTDPNLY